MLQAAFLSGTFSSGRHSWPSYCLEQNPVLQRGRTERDVMKLEANCL